LEFCIFQHVLSEIIICFWVDKVDFPLPVNEADGRAWRPHANADFRTNPDQVEVMGPCARQTAKLGTVSVVAYFLT